MNHNKVLYKNKQLMPAGMESPAYRSSGYIYEVFLDPLAVSIFDEDHGIDEERWITMGKDKIGMILVVVHTFFIQGRDKKKIRIISARKATRNETKQYEGETP